MSVAPAIRTRDATELPGKRDEDWRWTDLRGLIRVLPEPSPKYGEVVQAGGPFASLGGREFVVINGRLNWWPDEGPAAPAVFTKDRPEAPLMLARHPMAGWAAEAAEDPRVTILRFEEGGTASLRFVSATSGTHHARVGVVVPKGVSATLLESYEAQADGYLANHLLEIYLDEGARLERIVLADDAAEGVSVSTAEVHLSPGATFIQFVATSGARRQRIETQVSHPGGHASLRLDGVYLLAEKRHADQTTVVTHEAVHGTTEQLTKGVVRDQARGVFQGRIVVAEGADHTDARMGHHALILSDRAEVDAKPELEIYADDVACAHGNTVGALDEDALFYSRQRGIPEPEARAMLTEAFIGEVVDRIEHEPAREIARAWAAQRLRGG